MGPRPFSRGNYQLARGHDLSAVETPCRGHDLTWAFLPRACFNGATTFQPWKPPGLRSVPRQCGGASMGPRPFSRGNIASPALVSTISWLQWGHDLSAVETCYQVVLKSRLKSFNGATTFQPWKREQRAQIERYIPAGFNGATTFQPWKRHLACSPLSFTAVLQWGHDLSAVETLYPVDQVLWVLLASMGPRPFSRGNQ